MLDDTDTSLIPEAVCELDEIIAGTSSNSDLRTIDTLLDDASHVAESLDDLDWDDFDLLKAPK
jgi:hypothetical protein